MTNPSAEGVRALNQRQMTPLMTSTDVKTEPPKDIAGAMNAIVSGSAIRAPLGNQS
jgi:hypothetical protein